VPVPVEPQLRLLPACVPAGPTVTARLETLDGNVNVHCSDAGSLPTVEVSESERLTGIPDAVDADESDTPARQDVAKRACRISALRIGIGISSMGATRASSYPGQNW